MRNTLFSIALILFSLPPVAAQEKPEFNADLAWNTLRAEYGVGIPSGTVSNKRFGLLSLSYTRRYSGRWGWRSGIQYASLEAPVDYYVGQRMRGSVVANFINIFLRRTEFFAGITPGYLLGDESYPTDTYGMTTSAGPILMKTGLQLDNRFSLTADAGITLSIPLWRFSLDITPAIHYVFTNNVNENSQTFDIKNNNPTGPLGVKPIHWLFTFSGGLSFLF